MAERTEQQQLELGPVCSLGTCRGAVHALGMCREHYGWWRRHGDEIVVRRLRETVGKMPAQAGDQTPLAGDGRRRNAR